MEKAEAIRIKGIVQGVGFRPAVWRYANSEHIRGRVWNDAEGVLIHAWGSREQLDRFVDRLRRESPPLAVIEAVERVPLHDPIAPREFSIVASESGEVRTGVASDAATCSECLREVMDPTNRRYRYPFTNCTHCGPRLSIIHAVPYDRANTSMAVFRQCPVCQSEYEDPADRRFHAQPNACGDCGPRVWLENGEGMRFVPAEGIDAVDAARRLIEQGRILAIKGIGGVHLACDAGNEHAVALLRQRKQRYYKAFALMAKDLEMARRYARIGAEAAALLRDKAAPIVILEAAGEPLASSIAPGQTTLGVMLPYSPLHHLLMQPLPRPIVLTSGNRSDEPQCIDNQDAKVRLDGIADYWLLHDRDIFNRLDDSVVRVADGQSITLRRARGYAPEAIVLPGGFASAPPVLAMGGELKNTFCLLKDGEAVLSQHMGDLENVPTLEDYRHNLSLYQQLFDNRPDVIAVDLHPNYLSTELGRTIADTEGFQLVEVQHHHAHIAACMAEKGMPLDGEPVLGVALDGLGFGTDETLWGGEFLLADYRGFRRMAHFNPVPMLGGVQAIREPWRNTFAHLLQALGWERVKSDYSRVDIIRFLENKPLANLKLMAEKGLNSPNASSCGRLFDAVAAAIGICRDGVGFEGQAAIEMEALASPFMHQEADNAYPYGIEKTAAGLRLHWKSLWKRLLRDLQQGTDRAVVAARFHQGLSRAVAETAATLCREHALDTVVLGGGVFQNRLLLQRVAYLLRKTDLDVWYPTKTPANDGGVSLGQAAVAAALSLRSEGTVWKGRSASDPLTNVE